MTSEWSTSATGIVGKMCCGYKYWYPLNEFSKDKSRKDGYECRCNDYRNELLESKLVGKKYRESNRSKLLMAIASSKKRGLGWNPIYENIIAESYVWHHPNKNDVVAIPTDLHELYVGTGFINGKHEFMLDQIIKQLYKEMK